MLPFRPFPLLANPHVQTVLGNLFASAELRFPSVLEVVQLSDGDRVVLHDSAPRSWGHGGPVAMLVHGLGGCHESPYMLRIAQLLALGGTRVYRMDLRGCGAGVTLARRLYSAACSDDVRAVVEHLHARHPGSPLLLAGFSLGGGIVLKAAGEFALPGLCAVLGVAAPLDLVRCAAQMARQPFYDAFYLHHLLRQVRRHQRIFPDLPRVRFPRGLTLRQFDDIYTAPRWGFADAQDYYRQASALPWVPKVRVPTLLLTARDDPFIVAASFEELAPSPTLEVHIAPHGGHLGFLGSDGQGGVRWAERQVADWLLAQAARVK